MQIFFFFPYSFKNFFFFVSSMQYTQNSVLYVLSVLNRDKEMRKYILEYKRPEYQQTPEYLVSLLDEQTLKEDYPDTELKYESKSLILPNLYVGSIKTEGQFDTIIYATNKKIYQEWLDRHVLKAKQTEYQLPLWDGDKMGALYDVASQSMTPEIFENVFNLIDTSLQKNQSVFVCCAQGKDRSAILVLYYLMKKYTLTRDQALRFLTEKRPIVGMEKFKHLVDTLDHEIRDKTSTIPV